MNRQGAADAREPRAELDQWARVVVDAAFAVHRDLGPGFLEAVYEEAMVIELGLRPIEASRQVSIPIMYRQRVISEARLDLLVEGELVVELKAVQELS
jgi:GxxExxY protein